MNRIEKSDVIKSAIRRGFRDGTSKLASRKCYGYEVNRDGCLVINPKEAEIVRRIFTQYFNGDSLGKIATSLERDHIASPTGRSQWSRETLKKLLSNEKYTGQVLLQKTVSTGISQLRNDGLISCYLYTGNHEAIISAELFQAVQAEKQRRAKQKI